MYQITTEEPRTPRRLNRSVPTELETIVLKAMAKDVAARYTTAQELADDLNRFLEYRPVLARRQSVVTRASKWSRRHRALVCMLAVFLVILSVVLAVSTFFVARQNRVAVQERNEAIRQRNEVIEREAGLRRHVHAADMKHAWEAWINGDLQQSQDLLQRYQPADGKEDLRSFAWYYLASLCRGTTRVFSQQQDVVYCLAYSPDGHMLASGGGEGVIVLQDSTTGQEIATLRGHTDEINHVTFSHDGKLLASAGEDKTVRLWDVASGQASRTLSGFQLPVAAVLITPDDKTLVAAEVNWPTGASQTTLWDVPTGERRRALSNRRALAISPDGRYLATCSKDRTVRLWDLPANLEQDVLPGQSSEILSGSFSPDGKLLAIGGRDLLLKVVDLCDTRHVTMLPSHASSVRSVTFSPDGALIASVGDDATVRLWSPKTVSSHRIFSAHTGRVWAAAFSPDGKTLATAGEDRTIRLADLSRTLPWVVTSDHYATYDGIAFLPDSRTLVSIVSCCVKFWNTETRELDGEFRSGEEYFCCMAVSVPRQILALATSAGNIHLLDATSRRVLKTIETGPGSVESLSFSADGRLLACTKDEPPFKRQAYVVQLWDAESGRQVFQSQYSSMPFFGPRFSFSPDGKTLLSSQIESEFRFLDLATLEERQLDSGYTAAVCEVAYSPDGTTIATSDSGRSIRLFDVHSVRQRAILLGNRGCVNTLAFSPDGKTLASGSTVGEVKLWDVNSGQELMTLKASTANVSYLTFSADGTKLAHV